MWLLNKQLIGAAVVMVVMSIVLLVPADSVSASGPSQAEAGTRTDPLIDDVVDIAVVAGIVAAFTSVISLLLYLYFTAWRPANLPKVEIIYSPISSHFVSDDAVVHALLIPNSGKKPARGVGLRYSFEPSFPIQTVFCDPAHIMITGGEGQSFVELNWNELSPHNQIMVRVTTRGNRETLAGLHPLAFKLWHKEGVILEYGLSPA